MQEQLFTLADAVRILRQPPYAITYLFTTGKLPEPRRIGGRRLFTHADLARISELLKLSPQIDSGREEDDRA